MLEPFDPWQTKDDCNRSSVVVAGMQLAPGDQVRLKPKAGADVFDLFLQGKIATITSIEEDFEGQIHLAVTVDDDPGRDLGQQLQSGHRFFFKTDEVEPLGSNDRSSA
jgi:hypothetical protein